MDMIMEHIFHGIVLFIFSGFLCIPLSIINIIYNGALHKNATEPFLSRQELVDGIYFLVSAIVFACNKYYIFASFIAIISIIIIIKSLKTIHNYKKLYDIEHKENNT